MIFTAYADGRFDLAGRWTRCAIGHGGVVAAKDKREGDGKSPAGLWPLRGLLYRPDRGVLPQTALPAQALQPTDGWCDAPGDVCYNRPVSLPHPARAERLWRADGIYDLIVVVGHNDQPVVAGAGSAIFLHVARRNLAATQGCVALTRGDLEVLLSHAKLGDALAISMASGSP